MKRNKLKNRLGIDIGKVIMAPVVGGKADTSFLRGGIEQAMQTPPSPGAIFNIRKLVKVFSGRVWLISKAGPNVQHKTLLWLQHQAFYDKTGVSAANVMFCLKRHEKALHCRTIRITHFIDDRIDVLCHLLGKVPYLYLFGEQPKIKKNPRWAIPVLNWNEASAAVLKDFRQ